MNLTPTARRRLSIASLVLLVAGLVVVASQAQGHDVPEPDLHDGGIWVTNQDKRLIGRTNAEIATVDTKLAAGAVGFDVLQSGDVVLVHQTDPSALAAIDPATASLVPGPELPNGAQVGLGASTAALLDEANGRLFVVEATSSTAALALDPASDIEPITTAEGPAALAVGVDGLVHLYERSSGRITTWSVEGEQVGSVTVEGGLADATLSAVGDRPVVLDGGRRHVPGADPVSVDVGETPVLQEPGPDADAVLVAGAERFVRVPFDGAVEPISAAGTGTPARPVRVGACDYAGWGGDPTWVQACDGDEAAVGAIPEMEAGAEVRFRVNHERVTLNSITEGSQLLFGDGDPIFIDADWAEAMSDEIEIDPEAAEETDEQAEPTCESPKNGDPVAEPDEDVFGTRRDRPVVVYPLRNDKDPDCDVILVQSVELQDPDAGTIGIIDGGRAVQVQVASDVDELSFDYVVADGRGGRDSSRATVSVVPEEQNDEPVLAAEETTVVTGGTVTHNVLATAYDPDGDILRLTRAEESGTATGTVKSNARGDVTFTAGNTPGTIEVGYTVGDGRGGEQTGVLSVEVVDRRENQPPDARNDAVQTFTGREVSVDVLDNDTDPNEDQLSIVRATSESSADVRWDPSSSEIRVAADDPGTVNVVYKVTDGEETSEAVLRVDVRRRGEKRPPVAVRDEVLLTAGEPAYVPVLDNDVDPDGEVLVVLGVSGLPDPSPINVTVLQRSVLKITADTPLTEPVELSYRISDGTDVADGRVLVEPAPTIEENRPPVVAADEYRVRAGGIVTFPVLSNDSDPDGDPIEVVAPPEEQRNVGRDGRLFLSDDGLLRYEAPPRARGSIRLIYSVRDSAENVASAEIVVHVLPADPDRNQPPVAPGLIGRTVAGQRVTIPVPVTTMDPDGDAVTLLGIEEPPELGTVVEVRPDALVYVPDDTAAGTDEFTYRVTDQHGAEATATVLVGVAGRPRENNPPIPVDDEASVRPGSTVSIPVLANDFDPDADPLTIATDDDVLPAPAEGRAVIENGEIRFTAPAKPEAERTSFRYTVDDGRGSRRSATVLLEFRDGDDNRPPIAEDDATDPQRPETELALPLLDNDRDPDQDPLRIVDVSLPDARISPDGKRVAFTMPAKAVQFTYLVSDGIDTARAAVSVPVIDPGADLPPIGRLDDDLEVDLGSSIEVDVLDNDEDPEGADLHVLRVLGVRHGSARITGDSVTFTASEDGYVGDAGFSYLVGDDPDPAVANTTVASARIKVIGDLNTPPELVDLPVDLPADRRARRRPPRRGRRPRSPRRAHLRDHRGRRRGRLGRGRRRRPRAGGDRCGHARQHRHHRPDRVRRDRRGRRDRHRHHHRVGGAAGHDRSRHRRDVPGRAGHHRRAQQRHQPVPRRAAHDPLGRRAEQRGRYHRGPGRFGRVHPDGRLLRHDDLRVPGGRLDRRPRPRGRRRHRHRHRDRPSVGPARAHLHRRRESQRPRPVVGPQRQRRRDHRLPAPGVGERVGYGRARGPQRLDQDVDGLENGVDYTFQVAAVNEAVTETGAEPTFSPASPACTPDEVPGQPNAPTTTFGDERLDVRWQLPENEGSPIERLILTNTTTGESETLGPKITEFTWKGLENGTNVRFTLTAQNARGKGPTSDLSTGDGIPAGKPGRPAAPDASPSVGARDGFLDVRWTWSNSLENGDAVERFRITSYRNGARDSQVEVGPGARSQTFSTDNGVEYRFTVEALNKAGWSAASPQSAAAVSAGTPKGANSVTASEGDTQTVLTLGGTVDDNGAAISRTEYDINNNANWQPLPADGRIGGLSNGTSYVFRVRAVNSEGPGPASAASNAIVPYGTPTTRRSVGP